MATKGWKNHKSERTGQRRINKDGLWCTIIEYNNSKDVYGIFDSGEKWHGTWQEFDKCIFGSPKEGAKERIGTHIINKRGYGATCIEYNKAHDIRIIFDDTNIVSKTTWDIFANRIEWKHPYEINKNGGISGKSKNKDYPKMHKTNSKEYNTWRSMIKRSRNIQEKERHPTYKEVEVCDEWIYYENFYKWIIQQENYNHFLMDNIKYNLDKDIIKKGNKIYSPDYCEIVPMKINLLFMNHKNKRKDDYPIGVRRQNNSNKFVAYISELLIGGKRNKRIGTYNTLEEAFLAYKESKENLIKQIADCEYEKGTITKRCYDAMYRYEVEITD